MCFDGDPVTLISSTTPKARKPHKCDECRRIIEPGETYHRDFYTFEGDTNTVRWCLQCNEARRWLKEVCDGWMYEGLGEELSEHRGEGYATGFLADKVGDGWRGLDGSVIAVARVRHWVDLSLWHAEKIGGY